MTVVWTISKGGLLVGPRVLVVGERLDSESGVLPRGPGGGPALFRGVWAAGLGCPTGRKVRRRPGGRGRASTGWLGAAAPGGGAGRRPGGGRARVARARGPAARSSGRRPGGRRGERWSSQGPV